jgi:two-component system, chemotaxis family, chemotaxis protein CheY
MKSATESVIRLPGYFGGHCVHIVIAEDNAITRRMIELAAARLAWSFESAADGLEALSAVERTVPNLDLVLADINMPKMNGIELARTIKDTPSLAGVPVVLMSSPDRESEAWRAGCNGFLAKPFSILALLDALNL